MDVPFNRVFQTQQAKLIPSTYKKGIITRVYEQAAVADVQVIGTSQTVLKRVPLAAHIDPTDIQVGSKCRIDQFDESNTNDMVVAYIYGAAFRGPAFTSGTVSVNNTGVTVAHGLGVIPDVYGMNLQEASVSDGPTLYFYQAPDEQNLFIKTTIGASNTVYWFAISF